MTVAKSRQTQGATGVATPLAVGPFAQTGDRRGGRGYRVAFWLVLVIQLVPIWSVRYPALADYPNHLARVSILSTYQDVDAFKARYEPAWRPIPNLAVDVVEHVLLRVVDIDRASKIFLSLIVVLFAVGCHALGVAAHGRPSWTALAATFFTYNFCLSWGFVNYMFGVGLFFLTLAWWMRARHHWTLGSLVGVALMTVAGYFAHLSSYALLVVGCGVLTILDVVRVRRVSAVHVLGLIPLALPLIPLAVALAHASGGTPISWWHPLVTKKLIGLAYPFITYHLRLDLVVGGLYGLVVLVAARPARCLETSKGLLVASGALLLLYLIAPMAGWTQTLYVDRRLIMPACVLALAATRLDVRRRAGRLVLAALIGLWGIRMAGVEWAWRAIDGDLRRQATLFEVLPADTTLFPVFLADRANPETWPYDMQFSHAAHYATLSRRAFVPSLFDDTTGYPVRVRRPAGVTPEIRRTTAPKDIPWDAILANFDYVWTYDLSGEYQQSVRSRCTLVAEAGHIQLYRTRR